MAMLEIKDLYVNYGMIAALKGISFEVNEGEVIALIGANGAGKTTTLHTITGLLHAKSGSITFNGVELTKTPAHKIVEMGIAHVPEGRRIFQNLTVLDNLKLGAFTRKDKENISKDIEMVYERFPRLAERKTQIAGTLSGGEQQMLAMGRALMSKDYVSALLRLQSWLLEWTIRLWSLKQRKVSSIWIVWLSLLPSCLLLIVRCLLLINR